MGKETFWPVACAALRTDCILEEASGRKHKSFTTLFKLAFSSDRARAHICHRHETYCHVPGQCHIHPSTSPRSYPLILSNGFCPEQGPETRRTSACKDSRYRVRGFSPLFPYSSLIYNADRGDASHHLTGSFLPQTYVFHTYS